MWAPHLFPYFHFWRHRAARVRAWAASPRPMPRASFSARRLATAQAYGDISAYADGHLHGVMAKCYEYEK